MLTTTDIKTILTLNGGAAKYQDIKVRYLPKNNTSLTDAEFKASWIIGLIMFYNMKNKSST